MIQDTSETHLRTTKMDAKIELAQGQYATVHADKAMMAIDDTTDTATITLLNMHPIPLPRPDGPWGLQSIMWDIVGEIKIPIPALNTLLLYYASVISGGLDILPFIEMYLKEHPRKQGFSFGPTGFQVVTNPATESQKNGD